MKPRDLLSFTLDRHAMGHDEPEADLCINAIPDYTEMACPCCAETPGSLEDGSTCPECCGAGVLVQVWSVTIYPKGDPRENADA